MRNPVGPLPSTIYWRRRAVALCVLALVALLIFWLVNSTGGGGGSGNNGSSGTHTPVGTITPGPEPTGTHITGRPGGRDTSGGDSGGSSGSSAGSSGSGGGSNGGSNGGATDGSSAGAGSSGGNDGGTSGTAGTSSSGGAASGGVATSGGSGNGGSGGQLPAGSTLPDCSPGSVQLSLRSVQNSYSPDETPVFELRAANSGSVSCKVDFGPAKAVFTITSTAGNAHTWASDDCPTAGSGSYLLQVPAHGSTTYTLRWNAKTSSPKCATPKGSAAAPGTYLIQARLSGYGAKQVSFVLSQD
ncbi:hypothetical protein ABZX65_21765 [Streptomyces sp. NPDC003300]|uniref:hypothetical protein n=1 Tax=unclassified Streptomyces TaxID=2593676 RepID=UPI0033BCB8E6